MFACFTRIPALWASLALVAACVSNDAPPSPDRGQGVLTGMFSGKKGGDPPPEEDPANDDPVPMELPIGTVQVVQEEGKFALIRSTKALSLEPGTEMMTYSLDGRPTAKLKLSPEQKGAFVVADIVEGMPGKGDRVLAMGVRHSGSGTTGGLVPGLGDDGDSRRQVLE